MLLEQIDSDIKNAMRNRESDKLLILRTLKGEIQRKADNPSDMDALAVIKKSIEGVKETTNSAIELTILEGYLPTQLTSAALASLAYSYISENSLEGVAGLGKTMGYFKANHVGTYDGGELSAVVKTLLGV